MAEHVDFVARDGYRHAMAPGGDARHEPIVQAGASHAQIRRAA
ncbi:MAG: hypothetical protein ACR2QA_14520 [Solirubrobacteraceae bacterium]